MSAKWPASRVALTWNAKRKQYLVATDGRPDVSPERSPVLRRHRGRPVRLATHKSGNRDVNGQPTPVVDLVGKGKVTVLRDGRSWQGNWSRKGVTAPTVFTAGRQPLTFSPTGTVWVLLGGTRQAVTVS